MQLEVARTAGFCFGVRRAVDMVYREAESGKGPVYTWGPIIHNELVVRDLENKGVRVLVDTDLDHLPPEGVVIIRSHGVSRAVEKALRSSGMTVVDATCPFVQKIHKIVQEESRSGRRILVTGNPGHPEVIGIKGWCDGPCDVIQSEADLEALSLDREEPVCMVSQTTFNDEYFQELVEKTGPLVYDKVVVNTICSATKERQTEAADLAKRSDIMLVVGSQSSSNTQKLYDICKAGCGNTYYIQTLADLVTVHFRSDSRVGMTAGASTPNNIIQEVSKYVRRRKF